MNVSLTPELETFVHREVKSGRHRTASEVVRLALRLLQRHEEYEKAKLESLRFDLHSADMDSERGDHTVIRTERDKRDFLERIKKRGRERLEATRKRRSA